VPSKCFCMYVDVSVCVARILHIYGVCIYMHVYMYVSVYMLFSGRVCTDGTSGTVEDQALSGILA
jgi:hypothetical protein